jgi:hypothetical protein
MMHLNTGSMATVTATPESFPTPEKSQALEDLRDTVRLHTTKSTDWLEEIRTFADLCLELNVSASELAEAFISGLPEK